MKVVPRYAAHKIGGSTDSTQEHSVLGLGTRTALGLFGASIDAELLCSCAMLGHCPVRHAYAGSLRSTMGHGF